MKAQNCKITVGGVEVEGVNSWKFEGFPEGLLTGEEIQP